MPNYFGFYIGKDPWHRSFNGRLMYYALRFGSGSFRTENFGELRGLRSRPATVRTNVAANTFVQEFGKEKTYVNWEFDQMQLEKLDEYGFSMYFRWSQRVPVTVRDNYYYLSGCFLLARFTEGFFDLQEMGDRSLGAWLCPNNRNPGIYFDTYDVATNT